MRSFHYKKFKVEKNLTGDTNKETSRYNVHSIDKKKNNFDRTVRRLQIETVLALYLLAVCLLDRLGQMY